MGISSWLRNYLRGGSTEFKGYEKMILHRVADLLPVDVQGKFMQRIESINLVQRIDGGREINCYVMRHGKPTLDAGTRIDAGVGEKLLAAVSVGGDPGTRNTGRIWLVDGNLFSMEFDMPTEHADPAKITDIQVVLGGIEIPPAGPTSLR